MSEAKARHQKDNDGRGISGGVWEEAGGCPILQMALLDNNLGYAQHEEFMNPPDIATGEKQSGYTTFIDTGGSVKGAATKVGGVIRLSTPATLDKEASLQGMAGAGVVGVIGSADPKALWFEARISTLLIASQSALIGLSEEGVAADSLLADTTGAQADKDLVGFRVLAATPTKVDAVYRKAGSAVVVVLAGAHTLVADTFVKLGVVYIPARHTQLPSAAVVRWFVNGLQVGADVKPTASGFPDGEKLVPVFAVKTHEGVAKSLDVDWYRIAQEA